MELCFQKLKYIYDTLKGEMLVLLPLIHYILTDLFSPAWQKNVRQITYEVMEAMREASQEAHGTRFIMQEADLPVG